jgi:hypothetical protein
VLAVAGLDESAARDVIVGAAREQGSSARSAPPRSPLRQSRWGALGFALPLATGAALVVHIVTDWSLAAALAIALLFAGAAAVVAARHLTPAARVDARRRVRVGLLAGVLGLAAYDSSRALIVLLSGFEIQPFKALPHFGRGLLGTGVSDTSAWIAGTGYHIANGLGFAVAYCLAVRRPNWRTGIVWALLLEAAMIAFYPSWLQIEALKEFTTMSLFGHLAFGAALGESARRLTMRPQRT